MSTFAKRRPRFRRVAEGLSAMRMTNRDLEILRRVSSHRFLRSSHIVALIGGSAQHLLRRLQRLYHHGYLDRPASQIDYYREGGSRTMAYCLAKRGAGHLRRALDIPFSKMVWSGGKGDAGRQFLEHALMVSDIMVAVELACRRSPSARFLSRDDVPIPPGTLKARDPFRWFVTVSTRHRAGVIPDAVFGLEFSGLPEGRNRAWFFVEADRGTMPVVRQNLSQSSYFRKLLSYEATWTQRIHKTRLGLHRFRVLTVTSSSKRVASIAEACRHLERGRGLFLFADAESFAASPDILRHAWTAAGGTDALAPASPPPGPGLSGSIDRIEGGTLGLNHEKKEDGQRHTKRAPQQDQFHKD